jgi:hypothetical protein
MVKFEGHKTVKQPTIGIDRISNSTIEPKTRNNFSFKGTSFLKKGASIENKHKRRESFSLTHTKYTDARTLWHPLKDSKTPILNDLATIEKMKKANRYPVPEKLLHKPEDF